MNENDAPEQYVRTVYKTVEFELFYNSLQPKVQTKFDYVINVISTVYNVSTKFVKHLVSSDLYEMRVSWVLMSIEQFFSLLTTKILSKLKI